MSLSSVQFLELEDIIGEPLFLGRILVYLNLGGCHRAARI
jgi:hypothetical protein